MLDKVIMVPFALFLVFLFAFFAVTGVGMFGQWVAVQNQAQFVASSMGKWGGYTAEADRAVDEFARRINVPRERIEVRVSNTAPVPWGTPVWARITVPFDFRVGQYEVGTYSLTGVGQSVSSYLPGAYSGVEYTSP